jgi:hypothetical protein
MLLERQGGNLAVTGVALVIAVGEPRCKFSQIALPDCLTAQRTERLRAGCPAIHQDKFRVPPPRSVFLGLDSCREQAAKKTPDEEPAKKVHWGASSFARSATSVASKGCGERARLAETHHLISVTEDSGSWE